MQDFTNFEEHLVEVGAECTVYFVNPDYKTALIGVTVHDSITRAVYDYDKMVEYLINTEDMSEDEAIDWIEYNTIRSIPYIGDNAPIIITTL